MQTHVVMDLKFGMKLAFISKYHDVLPSDTSEKLGINPND